MNESAKKFFLIWGISFITASAVYALICLIIKYRLNLDIPYLKVFAGAAVSGLFAAASVSIFRAKKGNVILKTLVGLAVFLPAVLVMRRVFGIAVFRYGFVIYAASAVFALIYGIIVFINAAKAKKEADKLNALLKNTKSDNNR